ncbi:cytochrome P450 [Nocardia arizonensis]|uniref:cytochrome P450 n=1 Tax=Nocardia arizonensis TaxID=1141647 RepID=UPI0006CFF91F|nr:cytochrome P450 [Nocardia arizonensis]
MSELDAIPFAPGRRPFVGHAPAFLDDPIGFVSSLPAYGKLCRIQLGPTAIVVVGDRELIRGVLLDDRTYDKGGPFYERSRDVAGNGLGSCPHHQHRRQRRLCQPAFREDRVRGYAETMSRSVQRALAGWTDGAVVDLSAAMVEFGVDAAVRTMFSASLSEHAIGSASDDLGVIAEGLFRRTVLPAAVNRLPTPGNRRFFAARRRIRGLAADMIAERRRSSVDRGDLLSALLAARDVGASAASACDAELSDRELVDQVFTFFLAGAETTAGALTWSLYLLGRHPDIAAAVHAEVDTVLAGRAARAADLVDLPLVNRVLTETLRLYPPGWLLTRVVSADTTLGGVAIPAGTTIAVSPHTVHRDPSIYLRPHDFVPDRWLAVTPDRTGYLPFGAGARRCIGDRFALVEAGIALATIASRWQLTATEAGPLTITLRELPAPRALPMRLTARTALDRETPRT